MNAVEHLQALHFRIRTGDADWKDCINWAIERLRRDEEGDDLDVVMLAAATKEDEVDPLVVQIVERYIAPGAISNELAAGKENVVSLEPKFWRLFYDLGQPDWLVVRSRMNRC